MRSCWAAACAQVNTTAIAAEGTTRSVSKFSIDWVDTFCHRFVRVSSWRQGNRARQFPAGCSETPIVVAGFVEDCPAFKPVSASTRSARSCTVPSRNFVRNPHRGTSARNSSSSVQSFAKSLRPTGIGVIKETDPQAGSAEPRQVRRRHHAFPEISCRTRKMVVRWTRRSMGVSSGRHSFPSGFPEDCPDTSTYSPSRNKYIGTSSAYSTYCSTPFSPRR